MLTNLSSPVHQRRVTDRRSLAPHNVCLNDWIRQAVSRPSLQPVWSTLLKLCHAGMNYGGGQSVSNSGELAALAFAVHSVAAADPVVLFDIGANNGEYLEAALGVFDKGVRVFSFEPQSSSFELLYSRFAADQRVALKNAAVGKEAGVVNLFFSCGKETTASLHTGRGFEESRYESVPITTVDAVCREEGIERIHVLKIDTEGHEMDVLSGARRMLEEGRISTIQFEFGETFLRTGHYFCDAFDLLSPSYAIYRILRSGLYELPRYTSDLEVYKLSNFMCIQRPLHSLAD